MSDGRVLFCRGEEDEADHDDIWDDTELIAAYDRALASARAELGMTGGAAEEKLSKKWRIGDFCRAVFAADGQSYEAEIVSIGGARCRLRYVGYGNEEDQPLARLQPSAGKRERRRQEKQAETEAEVELEEGNGDGQEGESDEKEEEAEEVTAVEDRSNERVKSRARRSAKHPESVAYSSAPASQTYPGQSHYPGAHAEYPGWPAWDPAAAAGPWGCQNAPWAPARGPWGGSPWGAHAGYGSRVPPPGPPGPSWNAPPPPPPPPPPPVSGDADPVALANMLMSWYISGYHTGYYQASREAGGGGGK